MEENEKKEEEEVVYTDGDFLKLMKEIEREALSEIDPEALRCFDEEDKVNVKGR